MPLAGAGARLRGLRALGAGSHLGGLRAGLNGALLGVLLLAAACGGAPPDFVTPRGAAFFLNGSSLISAEETVAQEARFVERLEAAGLADDGRCWSQVQVHIVPGGVFPCAGAADRTCAGEQYGAQLKVADAPPGESAWRHELLHWLLECRGEPPDHAHATDVWRLVEG